MAKLDCYDLLGIMKNVSGTEIRNETEANFKLLPLNLDSLETFKKDMQEAFQKGAMNESFAPDTIILPREDINKALLTQGTFAYRAVVDGKLIGGAIVIINKRTRHNRLEFLYVKYEEQNKGFGKKIWKAIEKLYPDTKVWETCTPYFEKRNLHFYINQCGFHAVEFVNPPLKDPDISDNMNYFFRLEKEMNPPALYNGIKIRTEKELYNRNRAYIQIQPNITF